MVSRWQALGECARGAQHVRESKTLQDALHWTPRLTGIGPPLIMAVADGHGSPRSFRSHIGASIAVYEACKILTETATLSLPEISRLANDKIPQTLERSWKENVARSFSRSPFSDQDQAILGKTPPELAYGATLLTALVTDSFIGYWQLGDGEILTVWEDGRVERPLPKDTRLFANETTSLCGKDAWKDFRCYVQPLVEHPPALILLCTDGYSNSFADDEGFLQAGRDFLGLLKTKGSAYVSRELPGWLNQTSANGCGDDVTLGLLWRME